MPCFKPLTAIDKGTDPETGKKIIHFLKRFNHEHSIFIPDKGVEVIKLPCGQCIGCRIDRTKQWAIRCIHESKLHNKNCFITLTFNDEHLDSAGSLQKRDFQLFMKRLRKRFPNDNIRYYHCGEYGEQLNRPHHHACLFNFDFPDKKLLTKGS